MGKVRLSLSSVIFFLSPFQDGFGGPKGIKGFQAFKARGGPLALGSKEIPEVSLWSLSSITKHQMTEYAGTISFARH